jgi:threonine aldolase
MPRDEAERRRLYWACERAIVYEHPPARRPRALLERLAAAADPELVGDAYGDGAPLARLEQRMCELLGTEAAVVMPSGTMAQQIALRIACDQRGPRSIAFHPTCHLELHEQDGHGRLHGLHSVLVGDRNRLIELEDLARVRETIAALLLELPQREIGGLLPTWDDLVAQCDHARERGWHLHLDGARLWESQPFYDRPHAEIAGLFDSVYVSLYKGLGGLSGCVLAGTRELVDEARVWQIRHGGRLRTQLPFSLAGEVGLDERLPIMPELWRKAAELAAALGTHPAIEIVPDPPQTPLFHLLLRGDGERLVEAALDIAEERRVWLFERLASTPSPTLHRLELTAGPATLDWSAGEVRALFDELLERAESRPARTSSDG